jgi:hypothetical protein
MLLFSYGSGWGLGIPLGGAAPTLSNALGRMSQGFRFFTVPGDMEMIWAGVNSYFAGANGTRSGGSKNQYHLWDHDLF